MRRAMHARKNTVDIHARIDESLYNLLTEQCTVEGCSIALFVRRSLITELIGSRASHKRSEVSGILKGQLLLGESDAD